MQPVSFMIVHSRWTKLDGQPKQNPIEASIWEPNPDKPGRLRFVRLKTKQELFEELGARLKAEDLVPDEYFSICTSARNPENQPLPTDSPRFMCFAVRGGSEGHYIHVGFVYDGKYQDLFLGKTLREGPDGLDYALQIANACTRAFHC